MVQMTDFYNDKMNERFSGEDTSTIQQWPGGYMRNLPESAAKQLRDHVLLMGGEVERAIDQATRALIERDSELAEKVLRDDDRIDLLELEADQLCVNLLARASADPHELRVIVTAVKITPILERIADHACN